MKSLGILSKDHAVSPRFPGVPPWDALAPEAKVAQANTMAAYGGMIDHMDVHIGRVINHLKEVSFDIRTLFFQQKQIKGTMASDRSDLEWGLDQIKAGKIRPVLDRALPLKDAAEAHRLVANNKVAGSIVLQPWAA